MGELYYDTVFHDSFGANVFHKYTLSKNLQDFVNRLFPLTEMPIIVIDNAFKILAYTKTDNLDDKMWNETMGSGYYGDEIIQEIIEKHWVEDQKISSNEPFFRTHVSSQYRHLISRIMFEGTFFGSIVILCVKDDVDDLFKRMRFISDMLSRFFIQDERIQVNKHRYNEAIFIDLLMGNIKTAALLHNRISSTDLESYAYFQLLSVPLKDHNKIAASNLIKNFEEMFPACWVVNYDEYIHALRAFNGKVKISKETGHRLNAIAERYFTQICLSGVTADLLELPIHYRNNLHSFKIANMIDEKRVLLEFENYRLFDLALTSVGDDIDNLDNHISTQVLKLREYDRLHGQNYFETLYNFLKYKESYCMTADRMYLHRNTVFYRISKIKEEFEINWDTFEDYVSIFFSCILASYKDIIKKNKKGDPVRG
jgi:sugar diacid utilization regulator